MYYGRETRLLNKDCLKKKLVTAANAKSEPSDKIVTRMTSHSEDGEPLIVTFFYGSCSVTSVYSFFFLRVQYSLKLDSKSQAF